MIANSGDFPLTVSSIYIGASRCEGFGFLVVTCGAFRVDPGEETAVLVKYTTYYPRDVVMTEITFVTSSSFRIAFSLRAEYFQGEGGVPVESSLNILLNESIVETFL